MDLVFRCIVALISIGLLLIYFYSVITTTLLNQQLLDPISYLITRIIRNILAPFIPSSCTYRRFKRVIVWFLPIFLFFMIIIWFTLVLISMANFYWIFNAETNWGQAIIDSGSALSTLGFQTPSNLQGHIITIVEGAMGLVVVVLIFTFVPGYLSAVEARERNMLQIVYSHVGPPASSIALLEWLLHLQNNGQLEATLEVWRIWFWEQERIITLNPFMAFVPSFYEGQFWLNATGSMLEATAFMSSTLQISQDIPVQSCFQTGTKMLSEIARSFRKPERLPPRVAASITPISRTEFETTCGRLAAIGAPLLADREKSWHQLTSLRSQYAENLAWITYVTMAPVTR